MRKFSENEKHKMRQIFARDAKWREQFYRKYKRAWDYHDTGATVDRAFLVNMLIGATGIQP